MRLESRGTIHAFEKTDHRTVIVFLALAATPNPKSFASAEFRLLGKANIRHTEQ